MQSHKFVHYLMTSLLAKLMSLDARHMLIDSMRLRRLVTLRIAVGTLMTVPLPMPGGLH